MPVITPVGTQMTPYFLTVNIGFISSPSKAFLYRTFDGGATWVNLTDPLIGKINQMYFISLSHGFLASAQGIFETRDTGGSWNKISPQNNNYFSVYAVRNRIFAATSEKVIFTIDNGKTWATIHATPQGLPRNDYVFGNKDSIVYMTGTDSIGNFDLFYSTNIGDSWSSNILDSIQTQDQSTEGLFSFPHCNDILRTYLPNNTDYYPIGYSSDFGKSWNVTLKTPEIGAWIAGNNCAQYVSNADGLDRMRGAIRSTDRGQTWKYLGGGPGFGEIDDADFHNLSVVGGGAIVYACDVGGHLWKTINGGDGKLSPVVPQISTGFTLSPGIGNTIIGKTCDTSLIQFNLQNYSCNNASIDSVGIIGLNPDEFSMKLLHHSFCTNIPDTLSVFIVPKILGFRNVTVHLGITDDDFDDLSQDLNFRIAVTQGILPKLVTQSPRLHSNIPGTLNYRIQPFCNASGNDTILLSNPSCESFKIKDVLFDADSLTKPDFKISLLTHFDLDKNSPNGKISIVFKPLTPGVKTGNVIIETSIGNDTIPVFALITIDTSTVAMQCDQFHSALCDSIDGYVTLYNISCGKISFNSITLQSPYRLLPIALPLDINSGDSAKLPIRFIPSQRGNNSIVANLTFKLGNGSKNFDTTLNLIGFASHGASVLSLSAKSIFFDTLHFLCDSSRRRITLFSTGCDSLPISAITISGDSDFRVSGFGSRGSEIASGDSMGFDVLLNPISIGNKSATITILLQDSTKVTVPVSGTVIPAKKILVSSAPETIDFGAQFTCESRDTIIILHNPSCVPVEVSGVGFQGSGFGSNTKFPITLQPGDSIALDIFTTFDTAGGNISHTSSMSYSSDADNTLHPVTLTKNYIFPQPVNLWLEADNSPQIDGSVWIVKVKSLARDLSLVNQINFTLDYDSDLITYLPGRSSIASSDGKQFQLSGNLIPASDSSIGLVAFQVYLAKDTSTFINFSNIVLEGRDTKITGCEVIPLTMGTEFVYKDQCGDPTIRRVMRDEPLQLGIRPNPAHDEIEIDIHSPLEQDAKVEIFDALGVNVLSDDKHLSTGLNTIRIPTKNFAEGLYFIRIGGVSGSFLKVK